MAWTSEYFILDGINSVDLGINGVSIVRTEAEIQTPWISGKNIIEDKIPFKDIPTFIRSDLQPLEFEIKFSILDDEYTDSILFELGKIFGKRKYVEFRTSDFIGKVFYIQNTSPINLITYGSNKGFYSFNARNCAPYAFCTPEISTFDCTSATPTSPITINIYNKSNVMHPKYQDFYYEPELWFDLDSSTTNFKILNESVGGEIFEMTNLTASESMYINNSTKQIVSSTGLYRISNLTDKRFLRLGYGLNILKVYYPSTIQFKCTYPVFI